MIVIDANLPPQAGEDDESAFVKAFTPYLNTAAREVTDGMKRRIAANRSTAYSNLINSILEKREGDYSRLVSTRARYARMVEEGTGPAAGRARYFPDPGGLLGYVKQRSGITWAKAGSRKRASQADEVNQRAWALARFINVHGTQPHPFAAPTATEMAPRVQALLAQGAAAGVQAMLGGGA